MKVALNTFVDFHGDFPKRDFREGTPGREVAEFLAAGLRDRGIEVQGVEDVDSGHCIDCVAARVHGIVRALRVPRGFAPRPLHVIHSEATRSARLAVVIGTQPLGGKSR
jgi:hypothetical protein